IIAGSLDQKPTSAFGAKVQQALLLAPTVFPIIFAALMGKFFRTYGLYRAERGVTLGTLEQLVGCQSLFAAIERQVILRRLSLIGVVATLFWALSPIGGQSALRLLSTSTHSTTYNTTVKYLPVMADRYSFLRGYSSLTRGRPFVDAIFTTSLQTARTSVGGVDSPMDIWGNVKIPNYYSLTILDNATSGSWISVNHSKAMPSSLIGIPVAGIPSSGSSNFTIVSRQWSVNCSSNDYIQTCRTGICWSPEIPEKTSSFTFELGHFYPDDPTRGRDTETTKSEANLIFTSMAGVGENNSVPASVANCKIRAGDFESAIHCNGKSCSVEAMRPWTDNFEGNRAISAYEAGLLFRGIEGVFVFDAGDAGSSQTERWLLDPNTDFSPHRGQYVNMTNVPLQPLSYRLGIVVNTFSRATYGTEFFMEGLNKDIGYYDDAITDNGEHISFNSSQAQVENITGNVYVCHWTWTILLLTTSSILLLAGTISIFLKTITLAPDILGYASSMMRDNPHANVFVGGSYLDGLEKTRLLQNVKVMIADVEVDSEVGHVALATQEGRDPQRLQKGRMYD
ncbi:uncharacterized protein K452DRAFT_223729, partial [Aplosporella prunicola CBS 121167]